MSYAGGLDCDEPSTFSSRVDGPSRSQQIRNIWRGKCGNLTERNAVLTTFLHSVLVTVVLLLLLFSFVVAVVIVAVAVVAVTIVVIGLAVVSHPYWFLAMLSYHMYR